MTYNFSVWNGYRYWKGRVVIIFVFGVQRQLKVTIISSPITKKGRENQTSISTHNTTNSREKDHLNFTTVSCTIYMFTVAEGREWTFWRVFQNFQVEIITRIIYGTVSIYKPKNVNKWINITVPQHVNFVQNPSANYIRIHTLYTRACIVYIDELLH